MMKRKNKQRHIMLVLLLTAVLVSGCVNTKIIPENLIRRTLNQYGDEYTKQNIDGVLSQVTDPFYQGDDSITHLEMRTQLEQQFAQPDPEGWTFQKAFFDVDDIVMQGDRAQVFTIWSIDERKVDGPEIRTIKTSMQVTLDKISTTVWKINRLRVLE